MCEGLVAFLMDRADYNKFMMRVVARDLLASLIFRPIMQHTTPYNINKVRLAELLSCSQVTKKLAFVDQVVVQVMLACFDSLPHNTSASARLITRTNSAWGTGSLATLLPPHPTPPSRFVSLQLMPHREVGECL